MQTDLDFLEETLVMGVAGKFITRAQQERIETFLREPGVSAHSVLAANMHAARSRTSLIFFLLGCADDYWNRKSMEA